MARLRPSPRPAQQPDDEDTLPELTTTTWFHHEHDVAKTSFWSVARRLPAIVREALGLAWQASPRDALATVVLNIAAGMMTTLGLLATSSVLGELFAGGPTRSTTRWNCGCSAPPRPCGSRRSTTPVSRRRWTAPTAAGCAKRPTSWTRRSTC